MVAENLPYKDIRNLLQTIASERVDKYLAENGMSSDGPIILPKAVRMPSPLEVKLQRLVDKKREQQINEEWHAAERRREEREARDAKLEHPYLRKVSKLQSCLCRVSDHQLTLYSLGWKDVNYKPRPRGW